MFQCLKDKIACLVVRGNTGLDYRPAAFPLAGTGLGLGALLGRTCHSVGGENDSPSPVCLQVPLSLQQPWEEQLAVRPVLWKRVHRQLSGKSMCLGDSGFDSEGPAESPTAHAPGWQQSEVQCFLRAGWVFSARPESGKIHFSMKLCGVAQEDTCRLWSGEAAHTDPAFLATAQWCGQQGQLGVSSLDPLGSSFYLSSTKPKLDRWGTGGRIGLQ